MSDVIQETLSIKTRSTIKQSQSLKSCDSGFVSLGQRISANCEYEGAEDVKKHIEPSTNYENKGTMNVKESSESRNVDGLESVA